MDVKAILLEELRSARRLTNKILAAMPESDIDFRPTPDEMDFGAQALHILSSYSTLFEGLTGKGWNWDQGMTRAAYPTQEAILRLSESETERLMSFVEGLAPERLFEQVQTGWGKEETVLGLLMSWITHEAHHRGQMVVYLRLRGIKPPEY